MGLGARFYAALLAVLLGAAFVSAAGADEWRGSYAYPDGKRSVAFTLTLSGSQGAVSGRTTEPNTFGNKSASQLFGNVRGTINGSSVAFTKTYDGTGGVSHSVQYRGTISGNSMSGSWSIGSTSGGFSATRVGGQVGGQVSASPCDRCERFRGNANQCSSCCQCQQTNNTNACKTQTNPDAYNACANRVSASRAACNAGCFGR
jgi:hypothetical protein